MSQLTLLKAFSDDTDGPAGREQGLRLAKSMAEKIGLKPVVESTRAADNSLLALMESLEGRKESILACAPKDTPPKWMEHFAGEWNETGDLVVHTAPCTRDNATALRAALTNLAPVPLGLKPSFGFGDRIGLGTPGHVEAMRLDGEGLAPIFAQQSIREMERTQRTAVQVLPDATWGAFRAGWRGPLGADADHLKTPAEVDETAAAGFTFFTLDHRGLHDQLLAGRLGKHLRLLRGGEA